MATESVQDVNQETSIDKPAESTQTTPISAEEVQQLKKLLDDQKKEISGLNRKVSESEKVIQQKELEKLGEKERAQKELEILNQQIAEKEKQRQDLERLDIIKSSLADAGIPGNFAKRISGLTEEEIQADVKEFKEYITNLVNDLKTKEVNAALGGKAPVSGSIPVSNDLQTQYTKAKQENNFALQTAIKRQAAKEGVTITD